VSVEKQKRLRAAQQFKLQAGKLGYSIERWHNRYSCEVRDRDGGGKLTVCVLACTFDLYEYRLQRYPGLLVVQEHDAAAPMPVLCLGDGHLYDPGVWSMEERADRQRRNRREVRLLISRLLIGDRGAAAQLSEMPLRTQQYYRARCADYLRGRVGRPWAS
jgi:hypothetical protein